MKVGCDPVKRFWPLRSFMLEIPITSPDFWQNEDDCAEEVLRRVFRSATAEEIPLFQERVACLREAGRVLCEVSRASNSGCTRHHTELAELQRICCRPDIRGGWLRGWFSQLTRGAFPLLPR